MRKDYRVIVLISILLGILIGFLVGKGFSPKIKIGTTITHKEVKFYDTVSVLDTVKVVQRVHKRSAYKPVNSGDTVLTEILDTTFCANKDTTFNDGAFVGVEVCSDALKPQDDVEIGLDYRAAPDTLTERLRVDTVTITEPTPILKDWKTYIIIILFTLIGTQLKG